MADDHICQCVYENKLETAQALAAGLTLAGGFSYGGAARAEQERGGIYPRLPPRGRAMFRLEGEKKMRAMGWLFAWSLLLPAAVAATKPAPEGPVVKVDGGMVRGGMRGKAAVFEGIPYAAAPVGELRWREPQPVKAWKGTRDATQPGASCFQSAAGLDPFFKPLAESYGASYTGEPGLNAGQSSEDCLYLNVWTPGWPARSALPVMVWLHGGSNMVGSGTQASYSGASLVEHGVILVTINYRLGVMGFFAHPELFAESPHHSASNYGILDQVAALKWVRQNIAQFGGDPGNVTVFGESAGAVDSGMLMASPLTTGLFRRVISESGPPFGLGPMHTLAEVEKLGAAIGKAAPGAGVSDLEKLRKLPAAEVEKIAAGVLMTHPEFKGLDTRSTIIDGWVMPQAPAKIFAEGKMQKVDLLVGLNGREFSAFRMAAAAAAKQSGARTSATDSLRALADTARPLYGGWTNLAVAYAVVQMLLHKEAGVDKATNEMLAGCPIGAMGTLVTAAGHPSYIYQFDRAIPGKGESALGAFHSLEIPFVFNTFGDRAWNWLPFTAADHRLSEVVESYWTNFAKTGNPNGAGLPNWPAWNNGDEPYMEFSPSATAGAKDGFSPHFCYLAPGRVKQLLSAN